MGLMKPRKIYTAAGTAMILFEVIKQLILTFHIGKGAYQWFYFPFQLCSVPMYLCIAAGISQNERVYDACTGFMASFGLLGGICAFFDTSGFHYPVWVLTVYSYVWHILLIVLGIYSAYIRKNTDFRPALKLFLICSLAAELINVSVTLFLGQDINMFYINLLVPCIQAVARDAAGVTGDVPAIIMYWGSVLLGGFAVNRAVYFIKKKLILSLL